MVLHKWHYAPNEERLAVAIYNYENTGEYPISFSVGETLHVLQRYGDWCYGYTARNPTVNGVFPHNYLHFKRCIVDKTSCSSVVRARESPLLQEVTAVIREWGQIYKKLYVNVDANLPATMSLFNKLIGLRRRIITATLPVDELREVKRDATSVIDYGNRLLGLDLVVRDENGNTVNADLVSVVELYRHHDRSSKQLNTSSNSAAEKEEKTNSAAPGSHCCLLVSLQTFVTRLEDDCELIFFIYNSQLNKAISENYTIMWGKSLFLRDLEQLANMRVIFSDVTLCDMNHLYLVCNVVKICQIFRGQDLSQRRASQAWLGVGSPNSSPLGSTTCINSVAGDVYRKPCGVAVLELAPLCSSTLSDDNGHHFMPLLLCSERDCLDGTLRKLTSSREQPQRDMKGQGVVCSLKVLRGDIDEVKGTLPHLFVGPVSVAQRMQFPDVPKPNGERNDLYLTLVSCQLGRSAKGYDKNMQVTVGVYTSSGEVIQDAIYCSAGAGSRDYYSSVVYRPDCHPRWMESFRVKLTIDQFEHAHVRFTFKQRSTNEGKEKGDKCFAVSYLRLKENSGEALCNNTHELAVYRVDSKKYTGADLSYLKLPQFRWSVTSGDRPAQGDFIFSHRDVFSVESQLCSDGLTQNADLLQVLKCTGDTTDVLTRLELLHRVPATELVRFLPPLLDVLFHVLDVVQHSAEVVYKALIAVFISVSDEKYNQFTTVLERYLENDFSSVLIGKRLLDVLQAQIDFITLSNAGLVNDSLPCLKYIFKFTMRSYVLHLSTYGNEVCEDLDETILNLIRSFSTLMAARKSFLGNIKLSCLKYLPDAIDSVIDLVSPVKLSQIVSELLFRADSQNLVIPRLQCVQTLISLQLFTRTDSRPHLIGALTKIVAELFDTWNVQGGLKSSKSIHMHGRSQAKLARVFGSDANSFSCGATLTRDSSFRAMGSDRFALLRDKQLNLSVSISSDVMDMLWKLGGADDTDMQHILGNLLLKLVKVIIDINRDEPLVCNLVAILCSVVRQMKKVHYDYFMAKMVSGSDQLDFLIKMLMMFQDLISRCVFPSHWCEMIMIQNCEILKAIRFMSHTIRDRFLNPFNLQLCNNFFHCAIVFLTQPSLQLENFSSAKQTRLLHRYKDMRKMTALEIHTMWISLGQHKMAFVPSMVGPFLEMTLVPDSELRSMTIPLFFDMMQCEFYSPSRPGVEYRTTKRDTQAIKCNFDEFQYEMVSKLDHLIEGGRGDANYLKIFRAKISENCERHSSMKEQGLKFVETVGELMERLLEYRNITSEDTRENKMICTANLLHFYHEINFVEMYMRYMNKLFSLHLTAGNYAEAAFTLQLHIDLLQWSDSLLPSLLRHNSHPSVETHRQLKLILCYDMISNFERGCLYERALDHCKELRNQCEANYDYVELSKLSMRISELYDRIMNEHRPHPEYFRVGFYGCGFPGFLRNKVYVYRGLSCERLGDFTLRMQAEFPRADVLKSLSPPAADVTESHSQYLQINKVDPCTESVMERFNGIAVPDRIVHYYKGNEVDSFTYSRPMPRGTTDKNNPFANLWLERNFLRTVHTLPGLLSSSPVSSTSSYDVTPLENAVETMESANSQLRHLVLSYRNNSSLALNPLTQKLNGTIDAAVMGGISNYEKAFFTESYVKEHADEIEMINRLKEVIAKQIPLLEAGLEVHADLVPDSLQPLQQRLVELFTTMKADVEAKFGRQSCDLPAYKVGLRSRRFVSQASNRARISTESTDIRSSANFSARVPRNHRLSTTSISSNTSSLPNEVLPPSVCTSTPQNSVTSSSEARRSVISNTDSSVSSTELTPINNGVKVDRSSKVSLVELRKGGTLITTNSDSTSAVVQTDADGDVVPPPLPQKVRRNPPSGQEVSNGTVDGVPQDQTFSEEAV